MADIVSPAKRSRMMAGIKGKDTKPEIYIRQLLHAQGYRFRLHRKDLPGRPDIVLSKYKTAIFVQGCFWHGHENCHLFRLPKSRTEFWKDKIGGNKKRDQQKLLALRGLDWRVLWIWECTVKGKQKIMPEMLASKLHDFLRSGGISFMEIRG